MSHRLHLAIGLTVLTSALACAFAGAAGALAETTESSGKVKYRVDAASYFEPYSGDETWIKAHFSLIKAFPPAGDHYIKYGLPVIGYHDAATEGQAPLEPSQVEAYVAKVKRDASAGYAGTFIDDANWTYSPSPGPQEREALLVEAIRAAIPTGLIEMNSQYHDIYPLYKAGDAFVLRALAAVGAGGNGLLCKEFGVGPTSGINTASDYANFLSFADELKAKGIHITMTSDPNSPTLQTAEYNLATYFLLNDGHDYITGHRQTPVNWWSGFDANLGEATGARYSWNNLLRRDFTGGMVLVNPPGSPAQTVSLPSPMQGLGGATVTSVALAASAGIVLAGTVPAAPAGAPAPSASAPPSPLWTATTLHTKVIGSSPLSPSGHARRGDQPGVGKRGSGDAPSTRGFKREAGRRHHRRAGEVRKRARTARRHTRRTARHRATLTQISGVVLHATRGTVAIKIDVRRHGRWMAVRTLSLGVSVAGRFASVLRLGSAGRYRLLAIYTGATGYSPSSSRYRLLVIRAR